MNGEYASLKSLQHSDGWKVLQALWAKQGTEMLEKMHKAAEKGNESAWRYWAGKMKGFEIAIFQVDRALLQMEKENEDLSSEKVETVEELLKSIKGEKHD